MILKSVPTLFDPAKAEALVVEMMADPDGWTFKAKHAETATGKSLIEAYDEDGDFVAYL